VALLPDAVFFSRAIPVPAAATRAEVASQVEIALEALSPFPLAQLYYGYYWPAGSDRALAYAAYRRRFTVEQLEEWGRADYVLPAFASVLGCELPPGSTVVLGSPEGFTAVRWDKGPVPAVVVYQPVPAAAPEADRAAARLRIIAAAGGTGQVFDADAAPAARAGAGDRDLAFGSEGLACRLPAEVAGFLDVRDKAELEARSRAFRRDVLLWRVLVGAAAACLLFAACEVSIFGAGLWQRARLARVAGQKPTVNRIMDEQELAGRIDELSTKRLLPLEMISASAPEVALPKAPSSIQFLRANTDQLNTIEIEAQTTNAGEIPSYRSALEQVGSVDRVEIRDQRARENVVTFKLIVTFKPGALAPATS
jgi:hypothetical protein